MNNVVRSIRTFFAELRRRNVYRVAVTYAAVGFVVIEAADLVFPRIDLPPWTVTLVIALVGLGFPIALVMAWALEVTPEGVQVEETAAEKIEGSAEAPAPASTTRDIWVGASVLALLLLGTWWMWSGPGSGGAAENTERNSPQVDERSIAVLPFEALGQEKPSVFTEGMHDDLLTRLSNVSALKVISRTAVRQYRDTELTTAEIADSLGVRWILEGGVQEMGDRIQVNAQLIDPRSETHVWAEDYQRDLTAEDLFAIQGEITGEIADALKAKLTAGEQDRITGAPTENLQAYRLYVKGRSNLDRRTEEGMVKAAKYFQKALREDSTYARAWAGIADAAILVPIFGPDTLGVRLPGYEDAARRALKLDPDLAEAHASMGGVYIQSEHRNAPAALRHLRRAVALKPSYAHAHNFLGMIWFTIGRLEEALKHTRLAVELDPRLTTARVRLIGALLSQGAVKEAEAQLGRFTQEQRQTLTFKVTKKDVLYYAGEWTRLETLAKRHLESGVGYEGTQRFYLARIAARRGDTTAAREQLAKISTWENESQRPYWEGLLYAVLGEPGSAFAAWRKVEVEGWNTFPSWSLRYYYPDVLGPLREDPRYEEIIREINQVWGLNPDGSIPEEADLPLTQTERSQAE